MSRRMSHRMPRRLARQHLKNALVAASFLASLCALAGCSALPESQPQIVTSRKPNPAYTLTVTPGKTDTPAAVAERYGAPVLVWEPGSYALLGLDTPPLGPQAANAELSGNADVFYAGGEMTAFMNGRSRMWARGSSNVWMGGRSRMWARGGAQLWSQGTFAWLPENTAKWRQIRLQKAQALAPKLGAGVKVAVIDTGVDLRHPALAEALAPAGEWRDFYSGDNTPQEEGGFADDGFGHGTNVAGIVRQIAPRATILPIRVLGPDGGGNVADVTVAIQYAASQGARIINLSLGSDVPFGVVDKAVRKAGLKGVFIVASSGNSGDRAVTYPASSARILGADLVAVASVNARDVKSSFSSYGDAVELAAPGEVVYGPAPNLGLAAWTGTSQAAPMVSGALALALGERPTVSRSGLSALVASSSDGIYKVNPSFKNQLGKGRLNLETFIRRVLER